MSNHEVELKDIRVSHHDPAKGGYSGEVTLETKSGRGSVELRFPFHQKRSLDDAVIEALHEFAEWGKEVSEAAHKTLREIPKRP